MAQSPQAVTRKLSKSMSESENSEEESVPPPTPTGSVSARLYNLQITHTEDNTHFTPAARLSLTPLRDEYKEYSVPPNFLYAELHRKSHRVLQLAAKFEEDNEALDDYCPCCNYPIEGALFPLWGDVRRLNELGAGFPLFYDMAKYLMSILAVVICVSGAYCLACNYRAGRISDYDHALNHHLILSGTLANHGLHTSPAVLQPWLHTTCVWLILALYCCLLLRHQRMKRELDVTAITPSDYTVMLTNVPCDAGEEQLKEFLEKNGRPDGVRCSVVKLNFVYRVSELVTAKRRLEEAHGALAMAHQSQLRPLFPPLFSFNRVRHSVSEYQSRLSSLEADIKRLESSSQLEFTHVVFATLDQDEGDWHAEAKSIIKFLDRPQLTSTADILRHVFCPWRSRGWRNEFMGVRLVTKRPPEPSDLIWENIGVSGIQEHRKTVYFRRAVTWAATILVLGLSILAIFFSSNIKSALRHLYSPSSVSISETVAYNVLSFLPSTIVVGINLLLTWIIKVTSKMEKHATVTSYNASVAVKMTVAMFLNTAIVSIIIHWKDFYSPRGLAAEMYNIMISNAVVQPLVYWLNVPHLYTRLRRHMALRKRATCLMTQRQAHLLFQGPEVDMPQRYATLLKTYLLTLIYAPMMPISLIFGAVAMGVQYWVDKYMLLRVHARPARLSHDLDDTMLRFIPIGALLYACANWVFFDDVGTEALIPGVVGVVSAGFFSVFPVKSITKIVRLRRSLHQVTNVYSFSESEKTYEDAAVDFVDDYDRLNPLTKDRGNQYWIDLVERKRGAEMAEKLRNALHGGAGKTLLQLFVQKQGVLGKKLGGLFTSLSTLPRNDHCHPSSPSDSRTRLSVFSKFVSTKFSMRHDSQFSNS